MTMDATMDGTTMSVAELLQVAMALPEKARASLASRLIDSLQPEKPAVDVDVMWAAEIDRRLAEVDAGTAKLVPASEALRQARAVIQRARQS